MLALGWDKLKDLPNHEQPSIKCPHCNRRHLIEYGKERQSDGTWKESKILSFYKCPKTKKSYLGGIRGKDITSLTRKNIMKNKAPKSKSFFEEIKELEKSTITENERNTSKLIDEFIKVKIPLIKEEIKKTVRSGRNSLIICDDHLHPVNKSLSTANIMNILVEQFPGFKVNLESWNFVISW